MIRSMVECLTALDESVWEEYLFSREPVADHIEKQKRHELYTGAVECGAELASSLAAGKTAIDSNDIVSQAGIQLERREDAGGAPAVFALFVEPDRIIINAKNAAATDEFIDNAGIRDLTGRVKTEDIVLAHELFHFFEFNTPGIFTLQKHIRLWKLGPFHNDSSIPVLGEIGAMSFARKLCGLDYTPYLFDVLMLYPTSPRRAETVFENILRFKKDT